MNRRAFMIHGGQILLSACSLSSMGMAREKHKNKILIIGAGVSGLSAASYLTQNGCTNVVVLEASNRIGGRVRTEHLSDGTAIEWGANWIHGLKQNPLAKFCKDQGIVYTKTPESEEGDFAYIIPSGIVGVKEYEKYFSIFNQIQKNLVKKVATLKKDKSMSALFSEEYKKAKLNDIEIKFMEHFSKIYIEENYGASMDELSGFEWGDSAWYSGGDHVFLKGYDQVPQALARNINIKFDEKVTHIKRSSHGIEVTTMDEKVWSAEHVIVTTPLGVLKSGQIQFWPKLPEKKEQAIAAAGFGHFVKIFVKLKNEYDFNKLQTLPSWIRSINLNAEKIKSFQLFNLEKFTHNHYLVGIAVGEEAQLLQKMSEVEIKNYIHQRVSILKPEDIMSAKPSQWSLDPLAMGSYSYPKVGVPTSYFDVIGESVGPLHFAGEACQSDLYGTVEAAFVSGQRAGEKIMNELTSQTQSNLIF